MDVDEPVGSVLEVFYSYPLQKYILSSSKIGGPPYCPLGD